MDIIATRTRGDERLVSFLACVANLNKPYNVQLVGDFKKTKYQETLIKTGRSQGHKISISKTGTDGTQLGTNLSELIKNVKKSGGDTIERKFVFFIDDDAIFNQDDLNTLRFYAEQHIVATYQQRDWDEKASNELRKYYHDAFFCDLYFTCISYSALYEIFTDEILDHLWQLTSAPQEAMLFSGAIFHAGLRTFLVDIPEAPYHAFIVDKRKYLLPPSEFITHIKQAHAAATVNDVIALCYAVEESQNAVHRDNGD